MIRGTTGRIWVDDEDEFAAHRVALGYPDEVTEQAVASCQEVLSAVTERQAPFDGVHVDWLARLRRADGADLSRPIARNMTLFSLFRPFWSD